jgi:mRNA interferase MazF
MAGIIYLRFEVWLVTLDPTKGGEIKKTRPCVIISPKEINEHMKTILIAPLTSTIKRFPFRLNCNFQNHEGQIALDHLRSVDKTRLVKKIGHIDEDIAVELCRLLNELFEY